MYKMESKKEVLNNLYQKHIKGTQPKIFVTYKVAVLCRLTNQVNKEILNKCGLSRVYVNTKVLNIFMIRSRQKNLILLLVICIKL